MRNLGPNTRRPPWIFRNNGNTICNNGINALMTPMKESKLVTAQAAQANKKPKVEKERKPNVRTPAKALFVCSVMRVSVRC